jgi:S-adenosylmethionine:tRNA ribosyltransferase-isomerase
MNAQQIKNININDYTYQLPDEKIARFPLEERDTSKILVFNNGEIKDDIYKNLADYLPANSLLVFNDTKVVEARLVFKKITGGVIEIFCIEPDDCYTDITTAMLQKQKIFWKCMVGGASKWKPGIVLQKEIITNDKKITLQATLFKRCADGFIIEFNCDNSLLTFAEILHLFGNIPIPPYLKRAEEEIDTTRYQTIYAKHDGSVAAPTAGLHFTKNIFNSLNKKNIEHCFLTLHVGAGTFKPIQASTLQQHPMHEEFIKINTDTLKKLLDVQEGVIAVGTTSLRTLESIYWLGVKTIVNNKIKPAEMTISQWEVYEELHEQATSLNKALTALLNWMQQQKINTLITRTQILIAPGYGFKTIKGLITNFHQPASTLILLIAALTGDKWKKLYQHALENSYRFLSYGDGCLLMP